MSSVNERTERRVATYLAWWLGGLSHRLAVLLERRADGLTAADRQRFAQQLLALRSVFDEATTARTLAAALARLAATAAQFPALLAALRRRR